MVHASEWMKTHEKHATRSAANSTKANLQMSLCTTSDQKSDQMVRLEQNSSRRIKAMHDH